MNSQRWTAVATQVNEAIDLLHALDANPDPVAQRRQQVQAAKKLRFAANLLDDEGRLEE